MKNESVRAFTLIELIVVVGIVALLVAGGLAAFTNFRDRRIVSDDARTVVEALRIAQRRALAGEKPDECRAGNYQFEGYRVTLNAASVESQAKCQEGTTNTVVTETNLSGGEIRSDLGWVDFRSVTGGASEGTIDICGTGSGSEYGFRITIDEAGSVSEPVQIEGGCP